MTAPTQADSTVAAPAPAASRLPEWALLPIAAVAWWIGGFLWWLLAGMGGAGGLGTRTALPLGVGWLSVLVLGALAGGVGAGLLGRLGRRRGRALAATGGGTALAVLVTVLQSRAAVTGESRGSFAGKPVVLAGLCAVVAAAAVAGWLLGSCAVLGWPGLGIGLGVLAGLAPSWSSSVVTAAAPDGGGPQLGTVVTWVGAAVLVTALVAVGVLPPMRLLWWPVVVLLAWFTGPVLTAAAYLEPLLRPGYGLPDTLPDALDGAWQVFRLSASPDARDLAPWVVAVIAALAVACVVPLLRRDRVTQPDGERADLPLQ